MKLALPSYVVCTRSVIPWSAGRLRHTAHLRIIAFVSLTGGLANKICDFIFSITWKKCCCQKLFDEQKNSIGKNHF